MNQNPDTAVETLQPDDFVIFNGYTFRDGKQFTCWRRGRDFIVSFEMEVTGVTITVLGCGFLFIEPSDETSCIAGLGVAPEFWARTSELELLPA